MTSDGHSSASLCNAVLSEWPGEKWTVPGLLCFRDLFFHKHEAGRSTIYSCLRHSHSLWLSGKGRISWTPASQTQKPGSLGRLTMGWRNWQPLTSDYFKQRAFPPISPSPHEQFTVVKSLTGLLYQFGLESSWQWIWAGSFLSFFYKLQQTTVLKSHAGSSWLEIVESREKE